MKNHYKKKKKSLNFETVKGECGGCKCPFVYGNYMIKKISLRASNEKDPYEQNQYLNPTL